GRFLLQASLAPPAREDKGPQVLSLPALENLDGRVVSAADGRPIAGALVWGMDPGTFQRSGPDGSYRLAVVQGFPRIVQAAAPGFLVSHGPMITGSLPQGPTVALEPSWAAGGVVVDEQGQPVAGVMVQALPQPSMFRPGSSEPTAARTVASGRFRISRLEAETPYRLRLSKPGFAPATADLPPLTPGQPVSNLRIVLRKGRTGFGRVVNRAEQPVAGAAVVLHPAFSGDMQMEMMMSLVSRESGYEATTGSDGRFEIRDLPAGTWDLAVEARRYAPLRVPGLVVPEGGGSTDLGTVILAPGVPVEGYVVDREGRPIAGAEVQVMEADAGFASFLEDPSPAAVTAADGFFRVEDRREGETINLVAGRAGYAPAGLQGVEIPAEEPVRIVLQAASAVEGKVVGPDGEPLANVMVFVMPADPMAIAAMGTSGMSQMMPATSSSNGSFRIENVSPGVIELHAMTLGRQQALLKNLEVQPGQDLTGLEVVLAPGAVVEGRVLSASGKPVTGAEVNVMGSNQAFGATSDGDGRYRLEGVSPGVHIIEATHKSYLPARRQLAVRAGDNTLDLTFEEGSARISGRVVDQSGAPVAGARVYLRQEEWSPTDPASSMSGADGAFTLSGVPDGVYQLFADKQGFARSREGKLIAVDGSPMGGIEVRLSPGGSIVGRILGLDFTDLSKVQVTAEYQMGQVMPDGSYRIDHVAPGEQRVTASLSGRARQAEGDVVLEPGVSEVRLDLEFRD
ncbi:MAG TPA: carboxypeptidase-like regulatory domain-containing protein, partial [Thermoanaerobaculia bacterium]|nr:carboxypeptidase-like regulatory domain-containing protein [Thermoanaerobaculia bacterium]